MRELTRLAFRDPLVAAAVQDQRGALDFGREVAHVDSGESFEEPDHVVGGRGGPLQRIESLPKLARGVGQELRREELPVRRVIAAPRQSAESEVERGLLPVLLGLRPHQPPSAVSADEDHSPYPLRVPDREAHRDRPALGEADQIEAI